MRAVVTKHHRLGGLDDINALQFSRLGGRRSQSRRPWWEVSSWLVDGASLCVLIWWVETEGNSLAFSCRDTNPTRRIPPPPSEASSEVNHLPKAPPPKHHHTEGQGFNIWILDTNIQSITTRNPNCNAKKKTQINRKTLKSYPAMQKFKHSSWTNS